MKQCGRCGTQNLNQQAACSACGLPLPPGETGLGGTILLDRDPPPEQSSALGATLLAHPPPPPAAALDAPPAASAPPSGTAPLNLRGTMLGIAPPMPAPPPEQAVNGSPSALGTTTPLANPSSLGSTLPIADASDNSRGGSAHPSQPPRAFAGTMIGMAPPFPSPPPAPLVEEPAAPATGVRLASDKRTVLGVARPGIAPLNPGQAKPVPAPASSLVPAQSQSQSHPQPQFHASKVGTEAEPRLRPAPPPARISFGAAMAIMASAVLLVMAGLAFFMLRGRGSVTAQAGLDSRGAEVLDLSCSECPDGTKTWIDTSPVAFRAGKAKLPLLKPLQVGENPIVLVLERPGRSREELALSIPIEFRVRGSTDGLTEDAPKVSVLASALAGTKLEVDGKPVTPDASGLARIDYDVAPEVTGAEASVKSLERSVPYKATTADGPAQTGTVAIRIGVTPLVVDAPGASITVGTSEIVIAGRTAPGSALKIGSSSVVLDPEGRFVSKQPLTLGDNQLVVRATLKDHAPRLVPIKVRRSDNLERDAALARSMAQVTYPDATRLGESAVGQNLALAGQLFDLRHDGYTSVLLVDVKGGCRKTPCLAKVVYGVETQLDKGRQLKAFGKLTRFVDGPRTGQRIPEMRAELVVAGAP
jgi:hypothetical protein